MEQMKTSLAKIAQAKTQNKRKLAELRNNYLATIYKGVVNNDNYRTIHRELYKETMKWKAKGYVFDKVMLQNADKIAKKISKQAKNNDLVIQTAKNISPDDLKNGSGMMGALAVFVFNAFNQADSYQNLTQNINGATARIENESKKDVIKKEVTENRKLPEPNIFYLASEHYDSADDHFNFQGRLYIDAGWRSVITDSDLRKQIEQFIANRGIETLQYITSKPVWLITRPNCRHYFKALSADDVLKISTGQLLDQYDMRWAEGDREYLQTIKHPTNKKWYDDARNAELILERYEERLRYHTSLYNVHKTEILEKAITKDKFLIDKWKNYLQSRR